MGTLAGPIHNNSVRLWAQPNIYELFMHIGLESGIHKSGLICSS